MIVFNRGPTIEILWRDLVICPSIEQYISMAKNSEWNLQNVTAVMQLMDVETSSFFRLFIRLAVTFSAERIDEYDLSLFM